MRSARLVPRSRRQASKLAGALAVALLLPAAAGAAELTVTLQPSPATVGDRVEAVLELTAPEVEVAGEPRFPVWGERWGAAEIVEEGSVVRSAAEEGDGLRFRQRLVVAAFRTGPLELPPKRVAVPGPAGTAELWTPEGLALEVASVLPDGAGEAEPRPPAIPEPLPLGRAFWLTLGCLAAVAAAALALARRHGPAAADAVRRQTPGEELESGLAAAGRAPSAAEGHVALSLALRRYLGRELAFPAAESTTAEIRRQLRSRRVPPAVEARSHEVLQACDRVKFAREPAERPALEARIEAAREIAAAMAAHLRPAPAERPREEAA